ncbi:MAG: PorV/PorQ family protein [Ignavibacteria bacterium]|nr:PorV/PorQ family protein [Ignavibacteria bacterium]
MNNRFLNYLAVACLILALGIQTGEAQNKRIGTAAASELLVPIGARDFAMGGASISTAKGVEAIHWNPAGLGRIGYSAEGMFSTMSYIGDIGVNYGAVGAHFSGIGSIGISVKTLDFGDIKLTTHDDPEGKGGRLFSPTYATIGFTYARDLTDAISVGTSVKVISEQIDRVSATGFAIDFGVQYTGLAGVRGLGVGVAVKNIGPQMKFDGPGLLRSGTASGERRPEQKYVIDAASFELPSLIEIGLSYGGAFEDNLKYSMNSSFTNNNLYYDEYRLGGEVGYTIEDLSLFGRAGMAMTPQAEEKENIFGPTFGFGIHYTMTGMSVSLDFAYRQVEFFDANQVISVKIGF